MQWFFFGECRGGVEITNVINQRVRLVNAILNANNQINYLEPQIVNTKLVHHSNYM